MERAQAALALAHARDVAPADWLAPSLAADITFRGDLAQADRCMKEALSDLPIDFAVQPAEGRKKRLLIADMDSTIVTSETLDDLAELVGLKDKIAPITMKSMRGEVSFEDSLRERVAMLAGTPLAVLERALERIDLTPGARILVRTLRANGCHTALVSGGFTFFTQMVAELCGFHEHRANELLHTSGFLTGKVKEPILGRETKAEALRELCSTLDIKPQEACSVGDGANDLAMIQAAGLGVAYRGKPKVRQGARFKIDHGDLTALLYLQGYREPDFCD